MFLETSEDVYLPENHFQTALYMITFQKVSALFLYLSLKHAQTHNFSFKPCHAVLHDACWRSPATCALVIVCVLTLKNGRFFKRKVKVKGLPFVFTICACMWQNRLDDQTHKTKSPSSLLANTEALSAFSQTSPQTLIFFFFSVCVHFQFLSLVPCFLLSLFFFFFPQGTAPSLRSDWIPML